jgi:hypothetical protein
MIWTKLFVKSRPRLHHHFLPKPNGSQIWLCQVLHQTRRERYVCNNAQILDFGTVFFTSITQQKKAFIIDNLHIFQTKLFIPAKSPMPTRLGSETLEPFIRMTSGTKKTLFEKTYKLPMAGNLNRKNLTEIAIVWWDAKYLTWKVCENRTCHILFSSESSENLIKKTHPLPLASFNILPTINQFKKIIILSNCSLFP